MPKKMPRPAILMSDEDAVLRLVLRSIISKNPGKGTELQRLATAFRALTGRKLADQRKERDELLETMTFDYSVASIQSGSAITPTPIAERVVEFHPSTMALKAKASVVRDLERKFSAHRKPLLDKYSFNSSWDEPLFYKSVRQIIGALEAASIPCDQTVLPPGYRDDVDNVKLKSAAEGADM